MMPPLNRVNSVEPLTGDAEGNTEPSRTCKAKALGVRKVQRIGGEETISHPRAPGDF